MNFAFDSALAGLRAGAQRFGIVAGNIVNAGNVGRAEPHDGFVPQRVAQTADAAGAPRVEARPVTPPAVRAHLPSHPLADADGVAGMPNVSLPGEFVELRVAQRSYEASLEVLETADALQRALVDETA